MKRIAPVLLVVSILLSGCAFWGAGKRVNLVTVRTYAMSYADAWDTLISTLHDEDELLAEEDVTNGTITTEWVARKPSLSWLRKGSSTRHRYRIKVDELAEAETRLTLRHNAQDYLGDGIWTAGHPSDKEVKKLLKKFEKRGEVEPLRNY